VDESAGKDEVRSELLRSAKTDALQELAAIFEGCLSNERYKGLALSEPLLSLRYLSIPKKQPKDPGSAYSQHATEGAFQSARDQ